MHRVSPYPDPTSYAAFLVAVLAMQLVPGPETMLVISRGIGQGRRVAFWTVLGHDAGGRRNPASSSCARDCLRRALLAVGFRAAALGGAAYLAWLGARLLFSRRRGTAGAA